MHHFYTIQTFENHNTKKPGREKEKEWGRRERNRRKEGGRGKKRDRKRGIVHIQTYIMQWQLAAFEKFIDECLYITEQHKAGCLQNHFVSWAGVRVWVSLDKDTGFTNQWWCVINLTLNFYMYTIVQES